MQNRTIVMKFGGASLSTPEQFEAISDLVINRGAEYSRICIVVSAMGKTTDELLLLAHKINPHPPQRELDMLLSVGERISMALLAMSLEKKGREAISFTGSQSGIITCGKHAEARIIDVTPHRLQKSLDQNKIVIVAGFQGVSRSKEITTLGRGGSDTTAVALAIALKAEKVEFYKDVPGLFSEDPKKNPEASLFSHINYDDALEIVSKGARILHQRCLELAKFNQMPLHVLSFKEEFRQFGGTCIEAKGPKNAIPIYEQEEVLTC